MSPATPQVSVIIPTYNRAADLRRCLSSLCRQVYADFEVLVCDDGSSDESAVVVHEFRASLNVTFNSVTRFGGPARPRNRGIAIARGKYLAFLDSDDWWAPEKLRISVAYLERGSDVVFHDLWRVTDTEQQQSLRRVRSYQPGVRTTFADLMTKGNALPNSSVVVRADCMRAIGGLSEDPALVSVEDFDAWLRLAERGYRFTRIRGCLGYYWMGGGNLTSRAGRPTADKYRSIHARHAAKLAPPDRRRAEAVLAYNCGRVHYLAGRKMESREDLSRCLLGDAPVVCRLKALAMLAAMAGHLSPTGAA